MSEKQPQAKPTAIARAKWGDALVNSGYTITPTVLIEHFVTVTGRDSIDFHIIEFLNSRWWKAESKPMPSKTTIAQAVGRHPNTVRRRIQRMEDDGLIQRVARRSATYKNTNLYLLDGLRKELEPFALQQMEDRTINKQLRTARAKQVRHPSKVKLRIVNT